MPLSCNYAKKPWLFCLDIGSSIWILDTLLQGFAADAAMVRFGLKEMVPRQFTPPTKNGPHGSRLFHQ